MQRLALAFAVITTMLCGELATTRAQAGTAVYPTDFATCGPLPSWYPRGWELMVRYRCSSYAYGPSYYQPTYSYPAAYRHRRSSIHAVHPVHRRPYLRPGWWW